MIYQLVVGQGPLFTVFSWFSAVVFYMPGELCPPILFGSIVLEEVV